MAEKGASPRSKMIQMMYLVLTALLALNVSAEVLNAFIKIDESIRVTTENFQTTNEQIYSEFVKSEKENPEKTKPFKIKADKIVEESNKLVDKIQELKLLLIKTADKTDHMGELDEHGHPAAPESLLKSKDNTNIGGEVMMTTAPRGEELKGMFDAYRDLLLGMVEEEGGNEGMSNSIKSNLNTEEVDGHDGKVSWATANFEHLPLIAVISLMSKMQSDIRNTQASMLNFLLSKIVAGEFTFNKIEAIVSSPSNYVLLNQPYKAEVFIAASDTTKAPEIYLNGSTTPLSVVEGKGIYTGSTGSIGIKSWGGVIKLKKPGTDEMMEFPFSSEYQVGAPSVAISPTKMNVFYIGVDNPVDVTASGVPAASVAASLSGSGTIKKLSNGKYIVRVKSTNDVKINVSAKVGDAQKSHGSMTFRCKRVPDPIAKVGGKSGGRIKKALLTRATVTASLENFPFDLSYPIISFVASTTQNGFTVSEKSSGSKMSNAQKQMIAEMKSGQKVYFEDIKAKAPDGSTRNLGTVKLVIN